MELFFLIFAFISVLGIFIAWPRSGLYALCFLLPVIGWSVTRGSFVLPIIDLVGLMVTAAFFIGEIAGMLKKGDSWQAPRWPLFFPIAIFLLISVLSSLLAGSPAYSLWYIARWPFFMYVAYIFVPYNLVSDARTLRRSVLAVVWGAAFVLASGYLSLYGQDWHNSFYRLKSLSFAGVYPFGENHNLIAEFLNVGAFLILMLRALAKKERIRRLWDIAFVMTSLAIILTFSRAGWITLALQLAVYAWTHFRAKKKKPASLVLAGLGLIIIIAPLIWRMAALQADNTSSTENRWLLTEISWRAFLDRPYLGQGSGEFINLVGSNLRFAAKYGDPIDSHGMLQKIIAENGAFGFAAWLFLLVYLLKLSVQAIRKYPGSRHWLLPLIVAGWGGLFFQFFNTSYYKGKVWLPIALGLAAIRLLEERKTKQQKDERQD